MPRQVIGESITDYIETPRGDWVKDWPGQAVLCVAQNYWTTYMHEAIRGVLVTWTNGDGVAEDDLGSLGCYDIRGTRSR